MSFSGKVVLVIGASSGIGASTAILFSTEGANVVMVGRNEAKLNNVADQCKKYKPSFIIKADVSKDNEAVAVVSQTMEKFKKLDILINNAGIISNASILEGNMLQSYDATMNINLRAMVHLTTLCAPHLIKTKGVIVNVSSVAATSVPKPVTLTPYYISKAGLNHFTRCAALELAPHGVRVNSISPGPVNTDILKNAGTTNVSFDGFKNVSPFKRISEPSEIADLIVYLSSDKAKSITGSDYVIDNGYLLLN